MALILLKWRVKTGVNTIRVTNDFGPLNRDL